MSQPARTKIELDLVAVEKPEDLEVCRVYCATANPVQVIVGETAAGRGILGVVDGGSPLGVETEADIAARKQLLRQIGYKL